VLVVGGYSALLLAVFYLVVDVWQRRLWCQPLVWMGANSITIYILAPLLSFREAARRLVGGDVHQFFETRVAQGAGDLAVMVVSFVLIFALLGFLYRRKVFIRL